MSKYISNSYCRFKAGRKSGWVSSFLAAFAGPAQGPRVDVPPQTTVTGSLSSILHRQSLLRVAAWNMESFLYHQLERQAASEGWIPLGERKTPDCPSCAHT